MRKQILLVETDEQTRIAVESALRQDGFEVVSVDSASRAEGILSVSSFDAALLGAWIQGEEGLYAVSWLSSEERSQTPFAVLCPQEAMIPELPEELVIRCPFAPEAIQSRVREMVGEEVVAAPLDSLATDPAAADSHAQDQVMADSQQIPFGGSSVGEDFLDQALGLDQLEVNESETMDAGDTTHVGPKPTSESLVGYEADVTNISSTQHSVTDTGEISVEAAKKALSDSQKGAPPQKEVELTTDHGKVTRPPQAPPLERAHPESPATLEDQEHHDYNWFISEMEGGPAQGQGAPLLPDSQSDQASKGQQPVRQSAEEFAKMVKKDISSGTKTSTKAGAKTRSKKAAPSAQSAAPVEEGVFDWHDVAADASEGSVAEVFSKRMAEAVAHEVADRLLKQLNSDKFTKLVESEIKKYIKKHS